VGSGEGEPEIAGADAPPASAPDALPTAVAGTNPAPKPLRELPTPHVARFDAFWDAYPKKVGRKACVGWWGKRRPDAALAQAMLDAIEDQGRGDQWQRGFIKDPIRWLQEERWLDEVPPPPVEIARGSRESLGRAAGVMSDDFVQRMKRSRPRGEGA
jgi:hypothetical protein